MALITFLLLMLTWLVFSGLFDAFHIGLGVISSAFVAYSWGGFLFQNKTVSFSNRVVEAVRLQVYLVWLTWQIVLANFQVLRLVFHPHTKRLISPGIVTFKTQLKGDFPKFVFATSITLTPGTVTVRIEDDMFTVHALTEEMAASLPGEMERRVKSVFERGE